MYKISMVLNHQQKDSVMTIEEPLYGKCWSMLEAIEAGETTREQALKDKLGIDNRHEEEVYINSAITAVRWKRLANKVAVKPTHK